jgi:phytoene desaturase
MSKTQSRPGIPVSTIVIIGGGISGLASAALLARDGHSVTIVEKNAELGGRAGSWEKDGFRFDTGPSWYLMPEVFDHFYKLLGTSAAEQLDLVTLDPGYRVFFEGEDAPIDVALDRDKNIAMFESIEAGAGAKLDTYLASARDTYEMAKAKFLYTSFEDLRPMMTADVLKRAGTLGKLLVEPLSKKVERTVSDTRLQKILQYPAVFLGSSPYITPSMYHLMSHLDLEDGVLYPMGGFSRMIESIVELARAEGVTIITGAPVTRILVSDDDPAKPVASGVEYRDASGAIVQVDADIVVSAADLHFTETTMLETRHQTYPKSYWDKGTPSSSGLLIYLGVQGSVPELEHHTLMFTSEWKRSFEAIFGADSSVPDPASIYICKPSAIDPTAAPEGFENLFVLVPIPADPSIGRGDSDGDGDARIEALADKIIEQIADWAKIPDLAARVTVRRTVGPRNFVENYNSWRGNALGPAHTLKQSAFFRAGNISKKVDGLYYVGSSTIPGVGLPMCLISAEVLLKRLRGDISTGPMHEPLVPMATHRFVAPEAVADSPTDEAQPGAVDSAGESLDTPR